MVCRHKDDQMEELTLDRVIAIHTRILREDGSDRRIIAEANLHQLIFSANRIPDCVHRAAFVFYFLAAYPAFREGNKRTACELSARILAHGGYEIAPADRLQLGHLLMGITAFTTDIADVETFLAEHARRTGRSPG